MLEKPRMTAQCTWGEGPDVLLINQGAVYMLYKDPHNLDRAVHGYSSEGSVDLTAAEARALAVRLFAAAGQAEELDKMCAEHDKEEENG